MADYYYVWCPGWGYGMNGTLWWYAASGVVKIVEGYLDGRSRAESVLRGRGGNVSVAGGVETEGRCGCRESQAQAQGLNLYASMFFWCAQWQ